MVQARDGGGLTSSTAVTINLTDVNEAPVVVSPHGNSSGDFSVAEDTLMIQPLAIRLAGGDFGLDIAVTKHNTPAGINDDHVTRPEATFFDYR